MAEFADAERVPLLAFQRLAAGEPVVLLDDLHRGEQAHLVAA